ncbi:c-type cytochrome [Singulisphaera acidiphila]|uniref:Copper type II ascorbate-dependent monooxygenase, C-terminal domain protein n=1 Tax=Singulisphaera acidiphila (strain ATCC BAA-1392 / DSM 18658 / VKM B-2454 / MOB10) TaxID=886293 RepID=L0DA01_SINAD|nr:cytochrome c [Singulisphaera acidiphila]AGA25695.1 Copper type II ascorbate-dependent monooxygenase, C-terminal domain protein [Singulisphaera acidiphila DSM 18658]
MPTRRIRRVAIALGFVTVASFGLILARGKGDQAAVVPGRSIVGAQMRIRPVPAQLVEELQSDETPITVGPVTYASDVAAIFQEKCQSCHRPGQVAPFSLLTYDQARRWAKPIREAVESRRMPPWHADPRVGHFLNDRSLSPRDRATLLAWIDQDTPLGDLKDLPPKKSFPKGWAIGSPDLVLTMAEPYEVVAEGVLSYQRFRVATGFTEDHWIQAAEARPGNRAVVHHICVFLADDRPKEHRLRDEVRELVCYAPGDLPSIFPPGTAKHLPAGAELDIEIHYTPIGTVQNDQSSVGLVFAQGPIRRRALTKGISQKEFLLPPGAANHPVHSSYRFAKDARLLSLMPHMHLRGKDFRYTATYPDGRMEVLLSVPAYDFGWQSVYRLAEPKPMPAGTRIDCLAHFDNSEENPANPDPSVAVRWGEQTFDEMMIGFIDFDEESPSLNSVAVQRRPQRVR